MQRIIEKINKFLTLYWDKRISRSAAALSYYITLSIFPFLICLNAILANTGITIIQILEDARGVIPSETIDYISGYITYISDNSSPILLASGIVAMLTTSAAGFRVLMQSISDCIGEARYTGVLSFVISFLLSIGFLVVLYAALVVMLTGQWLFNMFMDMFFDSPDLKKFAGFWKWLRFVILFLLLYLLITGIYSVAIRRRRVRSYILNEAALITAAVLVGVSYIFSLAIEMTSRYTLVYGSIASVIILMLWLYICGNIIIVGSVLCNYFTKAELRKTE